jgi:hypothetical protein
MRQFEKNLTRIDHTKKWNMLFFICQENDSFKTFAYAKKTRRYDCQLCADA